MSAEEELKELLDLRDERFDGKTVREIAQQAISLASDTEGDERDIINALVPALQAAFLLGKHGKPNEEIAQANAEHQRKYPEHAKLLANYERRETCQAFYDFLTQDKELHFGKQHKHVEACYSDFTKDTPSGWERATSCGLTTNYLNTVYEPPEDLLAQFLGIDRNKLETEKRAMLDGIAAERAKGGT